MMHCLSQS